jgi:hypothetical protein
MSSICSPRRPRKRIELILPAIGVALLPKCPFCVVALAGVLNAVGIGAFAYDRGLIPTIAILLALPPLFLIRRLAGWTRLLVLILMATGIGLHVLARTQDQPVAWQFAALVPYVIAIIWARPITRCRCERAQP